MWNLECLADNTRSRVTLYIGIICFWGISIAYYTAAFRPFETFVIIPAEYDSGSGWESGNEISGESSGEIHESLYSSPWTFSCETSNVEKDEMVCQRRLRHQDELPVSMDVCWLTCGNFSSLWPYPLKMETTSKTTVAFVPSGVNFSHLHGPTDQVESFLKQLSTITTTRLKKLFGPTVTKPASRHVSWKLAAVYIRLHTKTKELNPGLSTDESYKLTIVASGDERIVEIDIHGETVFGVRHGLETLMQLVAYDSDLECLRILSGVEISDWPKYPYRGLLVDTARNFLPVKDLKRVIDGMGYNKLNVLHWHLTDGTSFPFYSKSVPQMSQYGAYSMEKVYYPGQIRDLIQYGRLRGVKIIPELDAPAHAGHGWDWGPSESMGDLVLCLNATFPLSDCGSFPCSYLNPLNDNTYIVLDKLYSDFLDLFDSDLFHMGGDEVQPACWNTYDKIVKWLSEKESSDVIDLWGYFQQKAMKLLKSVADKSGQNNTRVIIWNSQLTASAKRDVFIDSKSYIIQLWDNVRSKEATELYENGYDLILSDVGTMYLDHGFGSWLGSEHNWPYKLWQYIYDYRMDQISSLSSVSSNNQTGATGRILGAEATLWGEKVNEFNVDMKLWPRGCALAENLWSNPSASSLPRPGSVYSRLNRQNMRMLSLGIQSDALQPESCYLSSGHCDDLRSHI